MEITPRVRNSKKKHNLVVNVSIQIPMLGSKLPLSYRSQQLSAPSSPSKPKKKQKGVPTPAIDKRTAYSSHLNTLRDIPSRRKHQAVVSNGQTPRSTIHRPRSGDVSPKKRPLTSRRAHEVVRNISILEQVGADEDSSIIRYTSNSGELAANSVAVKVATGVSDVDLEEMRRLRGHKEEGKEQQLTVRAAEILRTGCAKKIQRAWRNYKTKKLIRSYSNDIRRKEVTPMISASNSSCTGLRFKKKLPAQRTPPLESSPESQSNESSKGGKEEKVTCVKKFQEESLQRWEDIIEQIKNKKDIDKALKMSEQHKQQLQKDLGSKEKREAEDAWPVTTPESKSRNIESQPSSETKRDKRVQYFENEMLKIQNDLSDISHGSISSGVDDHKEQEQLENLKLRKKLELFKNHLPDYQAFEQPKTTPQRMDIASIIQKKNQQSRKVPQFFSEPVSTRQKREQSGEIPEQKPDLVGSIIQQVRLGEDDELSNEADYFEGRQLKRSSNIGIDEASISSVSSAGESSSVDNLNTHREWLCQRPEKDWVKDLRSYISRGTQEEDELMDKIMEELLLESLIEVAQSEKLIGLVKSIYQSRKNGANQQQKFKHEGIVTNQSSIRDYLNYFISYLQQLGLSQSIEMQLCRPVGPSALDVLRYYRGIDVDYDPDSEYVMSIGVFNKHWEYANSLIYFDQKYDDLKKEQERVTYLKKLTKMFYRAIFDGLNESLELERAYGVRGKPYPWSQPKFLTSLPDLQISLARAAQRVLRYAMVFCGVLFSERNHNLDAATMAQVQQQNIMKLVLLEINDDENMWNFFEDELVDVRLDICQFIERKLIAEALVEMRVDLPLQETSL